MKYKHIPFGFLLFVFMLFDGINFWPAVALYLAYKILVEP